MADGIGGKGTGTKGAGWGWWGGNPAFIIFLVLILLVFGDN